MLKKQEEFIGEFKKLKEVFVKAGLSLLNFSLSPYSLRLDISS